MKRFVWGIVVALVGLLSIAGAENNPQGRTGSVVVGLLCMVGGGLLTYVVGDISKAATRLAISR